MRRIFTSSCSLIAAFSPLHHFHHHFLFAYCFSLSHFLYNVAALHQKTFHYIRNLRKLSCAVLHFFPLLSKERGCSAPVKCLRISFWTRRFMLRAPVDACKGGSEDAFCDFFYFFLPTPRSHTHIRGSVYL